MDRYQVNETINGCSVVDTQSNQPVTPVYFVPFCGEQTTKDLADSICIRLNNSFDMECVSKYIYKPFKYAKNG